LWKINGGLKAGNLTKNTQQEHAGVTIVVLWFGPWVIAPVFSTGWGVVGGRGEGGWVGLPQGPNQKRG